MGSMNEQLLWTGPPPPPPFQGENLKEYIPITWVRARHGKMFLTTPRLGQKKKIVGCTARFHQHIGVFINVLVWDPNGNKTLEVVWGDEGNCWIKGFSFEQHESLWSKKKIFFPFISCLGLWFVLVDSFFFYCKPNWLQTEVSVIHAELVVAAHRPTASYKGLPKPVLFGYTFCGHPGRNSHHV